MMIEVVLLDRCQRWSHLQTFHWLDASQDVRAAVAAVAAAGYSFASPPVEGESDLYADSEVKENCRVTEAGQMGVTGE